MRRYVSNYFDFTQRINGSLVVTLGISVPFSNIINTTDIFNTFATLSLISVKDSFRNDLDL